jgi:hypothetical protein
MRVSCWLARRARVLQMACLAAPFFVAPFVGPFFAGCSDTRVDPLSCRVRGCGDGGLVCHANGRCGSGPEAGAVEDGLPDSATSSDSLLPPGTLDAPASGDAALDQAGLDQPTLPPSLDGAVGTGIDAAPSPSLDVAIDTAVDASLEAAVDTRIPDAPGTCALDTDCGGALPYCVEGRCAACRASAECQGGTPICSPGHACVSCALADGGCPASAPACEADSGRCVECTSNTDCPLAARPICDGASNTCAPCGSDDQCADTGPGVCMAHLDGHCAADTETVYVGATNLATCSDSASNAGSAAVPYCTAQRGVLAARAKGRPLVVITGSQAGGFTGVALTAPLTVVGKSATLVAADFSDGIGITGGEIYLRGLTVTGSVARQTGVGVNAQASTGASLVLHMDGCTIRGNPGGGILLGGAAFDITNTLVTGNGPGQTSAGTSFGGIRVDSLATSGGARLSLVTISDNLAPGLSCASGIEGTGVLASGNTVLNIATSCLVVSCGTAGPACGVQP